jgi:hypothetical protein
VSALTDQRAAGVTMAGEEAAVFFAAFSFWFLRFLSAEDEETLEPQALPARGRKPGA